MLSVRVVPGFIRFKLKNLMSVVEGYVYHTYGPDRYVRDAVASVLTLRRYDTKRPVALYCPHSHQRTLQEYGLDSYFQVLEDLPEDHRSITGFKHNLHRFSTFDRCLFVDSDMIWCRPLDPLWTQLSAFPFTATGLERADFFFGGPKGIGVALDYLLDRRRRTMKRFGISYLPRIQAGMIFSQNQELAQEVCNLASYFLSQRKDTHFRSRLNEGRTEETCEWSLAMAMSSLKLHVFPWFQGHNSPQLDFIEGLTEYDQDFESVSCRYYSNPFVYMLRGLTNPAIKNRLIQFFSALPGKGDYMNVTPFVLHFGWLHHKQPFRDFSARTWKELVSPHTQSVPLSIQADSMQAE